MLSDKKLHKIENTLGHEVVQELQASQDLKSAIVSAESAIKQAVDELEANEKYKELKEQLKALSQGLREVRKFQGAKIQYALHLLEEAGK